MRKQRSLSVPTAVPGRDAATACTLPICNFCRVHVYARAATRLIAQPSGGRPEAASEATPGCPADPHQSVASAGESSHGGAGPARAPAACSAGPSDAALPLLVRTGRTLATWTPAACQLEKPREAARGEVLGRRSRGSSGPLSGVRPSYLLPAEHTAHTLGERPGFAEK